MRSRKGGSNAPLHHCAMVPPLVRGLRGFQNSKASTTIRVSGPSGAFFKFNAHIVLVVCIMGNNADIEGPETCKWRSVTNRQTGHLARSWAQRIAARAKARESALRGCPAHVRTLVSPVLEKESPTMYGTGPALFPGGCPGRRQCRRPGAGAEERGRLDLLHYGATDTGIAHTL
jgi:hypothetical protein